MNAAALRARTLLIARLRMAVLLLPLIGVVWLFKNGHPLIAVTIFVSVLGTMSAGTLIPRWALFGPMILDLPPGSKHALLTIDDGPHPEHTPAILDILDRHGLKAVFFLIGERAAKHPELVREIAARGHEIGNHTQTHPAPSFWALRAGQLWREISTCQETLTAICPQHPPRFFRPPAGHHNVFLPVVTKALGLRLMMWSVRGFDGVSVDVDLITRRIQSRLRPGAIVLIHEATSVAVEVAESIATLISQAGLASNEPSTKTFGDDDVIVERHAAP